MPEPALRASCPPRPGFSSTLWTSVPVGMLASGIVGVAVHSAGYLRLEQDQAPMAQEGEEPGDTES